MPSLNEVRLLGNLGNDPEVRSTTNGDRVATFWLATSEKWNDDKGQQREKTEWHRVVCWNRGTYALADLVEKYVAKGALVLVSGKIEYRQWQDKHGEIHYSTEIRADRVTFLTPKGQPAALGKKVEETPETEPVPF